MNIQKTARTWAGLTAAGAMLWAGTAVAQAPDRVPDRQRVRQPTPQSVQQQEDAKESAEANKTEADRKVRAMDRRLKQTLRSICNGC